MDTREEVIPDGYKGGGYSLCRRGGVIDAAFTEGV